MNAGPMLFELLALNLGVTVVVMLMLWRVSVAIRDVSFIDAVWAYAMVGLAWLSLALMWGNGPGSLNGMHGRVAAVLVTLWGVRLGTHLLLRWRRLGRDPRYERILGNAMDKRGWSFARASLTIVFLLQGPLLWFVSLPAQVAIFAGNHGGLGPLAVVGVIVALTGIVFETVGDAQLEAFRKDPSKRGKVLDTGLWRYTRHPNYFGDACTWWGIWLVSAGTGIGAWTVLSPILMTWMLMKWSGAPLLERGLKKSRPGYADYVARTSGFFPMPPRNS